MIVDPPKKPTIIVKESTRTLTTLDLMFQPDTSDNGGSPIIGYLLQRDEGIAGSPFTQIYDGTTRPEII